MSKTNYVTIRIDYEADVRYDEESAKEVAIDRVMSYLSGAGLYNEENGLRVTDVENCGESF